MVLMDRAWAERDPETKILVYLDENLTDAEARSVGTKINTIPAVQKIDFISREEALEDFRADHGEDETFAGVEASDLRHRFLVTVLPEDLETVLAALEEIPEIVKIGGNTTALERIAILGPEQDPEAMAALVAALPELPELE
jgi:cell division transport system permease protein